jgi:hypothetical protein
MKRILILSVLLLFSQALHAQKFKEWFRQKKTQKAYLIEQIAQLKIYLELTEKGYKIAKEGLTTIGNIKNGEFKLHKNRFDSLLIVKSDISTLGRLQQIADMQDIVHEICETLPKDINTCEALDSEQKQRIRRAILVLYDDGQALIGALLPLIRDGNYKMTDDERLQRIEWLYRQFEANYSFARSFKMQIVLFCSQAYDEKNELLNRRKIHGLNQ